MDTRKSDAIYEILLQKGFAESLCREIAYKYMNTDYTATRMLGYLYRMTELKEEQLVDEMIAILEDRDRIIKKLEVYRLANIKSAKKRILVTETKAARNKSIRSEVKTVTKKVEAAVAANDKEAAKAALTVAISTIESAASKGVYHKNNSARKVSRLTKLVNAMA